jgi:hypothetical protein
MLKLGVVAVLAMGAVGCIRVDAEVEGITQAVSEQSFPGAGAYAGHETAMTFTVQLSPNNDLVSKVATAQVKNVRLEPKSGVQKLDFFKGITLALRAEGAPMLKLINVGEEQLKPGADGAIELPVVVDFDASKYLQETLTVEATLDLLAPADDWSMGMEFTLNVTGGTTLGL